jgi:S-adenosylmethionine:tRNA ribosyltransferase-isomerase
MRLEEFDYTLPPDLVAQEPVPERSDSRLLTLDRKSGALAETGFSGIVELFRPGDLLVVNDTRVIPARLLGRKESGGRVEVFLVRRLSRPEECWECLLRASKAVQPGGRIHLPEGVIATVVERRGDDSWTVAFSPGLDFSDWLERTGSMPLPPYIKRPVADSDRERYQTLFARVKGAVAAPTAGLHFTAGLIDALRSRGVEVMPLTLHVGLGTFLPVRVDDLREHRMHRERYDIPAATAAAVAARKQGDGRVIALGTTTVRALEHAAREDGTVPAGEGEADIFIYPGYRFRVVDALITNFHLPKSTLLMLVAAFAGRERLLAAYAEAVQRRFRFFSYGDAMFIL